MNPRDELRNLENLLEEPGWKWLTSLIEEQATLRTASIILSPLASMDAALEQEFQKGEISGMRLVPALVAGRIASLRSDLAREENENG